MYVGYWRYIKLSVKVRNILGTGLHVALSVGYEGVIVGSHVGRVLGYVGRSWV